MTNNKIQGYAERIENVLNEIDVLKGDIKDLYEEVKSADIKPKVLRRAIASKRRKVDAAFEAEVEEYSAALLAMPGATYRSVAEQTGIPKSTLQRRVPRERNGTTHHDPETGEISQPSQAANGGGDHVARSDLLTIDRQNDIDDDAPAGALKAGSSSTGDSHNGGLIAELEVARVAPPAIPASSSPPTLTTAIDTRSIAEVMGEHPEFLRRVRVA